MTKKKSSGRGRPSISPNGTVRISVRLPKLLWRQLEERAAVYGTTKSELLRKMIERVTQQ